MKKSKPPSPWISGSFYLIGFLIIIAAVAVVEHTSSIYALPIIFIVSISALVVIGAFQIRQDENLSQENFLKLIALSLKYLPLIKRQGESPPQAATRQRLTWDRVEKGTTTIRECWRMKQ